MSKASGAETAAHAAPTAAQLEFAADHDASIEGNGRARPGTMFVYGEHEGRAVRWLVTGTGEVVDTYYFEDLS